MRHCVCDPCDTESSTPKANAAGSLAERAAGDETSLAARTKRSSDRIVFAAGREPPKPACSFAYPMELS